MARPSAEPSFSGSSARPGARSTRASWFGARSPSFARAGRAGAFSFGLVVGFLLLGYAALRLLDLSPQSGGPALEPTPGLGAGAPEPAGAGAWHARVVAREGEGDAAVELCVLARLLPLHDEPALEEFRAQSLRQRYALPAGRPWRLYLSLAEPAAAPVLVRGVRVPGLAPFAELAPEPAGPDPVHALLAAVPGVLEGERAFPLVLWGVGPEPGAELELVLSRTNPPGADVRATGALEPVTPDEARSLAPRWYAGHAPPATAGARTLEEEVARLELELERERARRAEREQAFIEFGRVLGELPAGKQLGLAPEVEAIPPSPEEEQRRAAEAAARARAEELGRALGVLMRLEGLRGLDLMESGTLLPGPPSAIGPVVFRCLDERGQLAGSLAAERLRLSGSASAHTLTLILERGFESRGGQRMPFENDVRRITLREVDPEPWMRDCPELFEAAELEPENDDGRWVLSEVRRELNRLLALDTHLGWYRLHSLGGVLGAEYRDVQVEELESGGRVARRMFADRLTLALEDASLVLELRDGAVVRGEEKQPFRDGRLRIVLPGVPLESWRAARVPGFAEPPPREKAEAPRRAGG